MAHETISDKSGQQHHPAKTSDAKRPAKKKHAHHWRLLTMLVTLGVVVWFLPVIIAQTPLLTWGLKMATADLNGSVSVKSASLGWLSPIEIQGIEVKDKCGKPVLSVDSVVGDRRLGAILFNYTNLGKFTLAGMKVSVVMRDNSSNVEDLLAKYLAPKDNHPPPRPRSDWRSIFPMASRRSPTNGPAWRAKCGNCRSSSAWTPATDRWPPR